MKTYLRRTILVAMLAGAAPLSGQQTVQQLPPQAGASSATSMYNMPAADATLSSLLDAVGSANGQQLLDQARQAVFVVPAPDLAPDGLAAISEDMVVMCRILDKATGSARGTRAGAGMFDPYGSPAYVGRSPESGSRTQGLYLDGYGALFFVQVGFPLIAPTQEPEQPKTEQPTDPLWAQTVEELQGTPQKRPEAVAQKYDAQRVENLKSILLKSLRHAANLRVRGPQDAIAIVIRTRSGSAVANAYGERWSEMMMPSSPASDSSDVLVLRTTKADVDAFAKGDLTADQFTGKVQILRSWTNSGPERSSRGAVVVPNTGTRVRR